MFDSDSSDDSDGIAANIDFENLDRIKESVKFNDEAEMLAINDYQDFSFIWRLPGLPLKNYHDYIWTNFQDDTGITALDLRNEGNGGLWMYRTTARNHKQGQEDKKTSSRVTMPVDVFRKMTKYASKWRQYIGNFERYIDQQNKASMNEERICEEIVIHTFCTDDEKVNGQKKKVDDARIVVEILLKESNTLYEPELPPRKKSLSFFNVNQRDPGRNRIANPVQMIIRNKLVEANRSKLISVDKAVVTKIESAVNYNKITISSAKLFVDFLDAYGEEIITKINKNLIELSILKRKTPAAVAENDKSIGNDQYIKYDSLPPNRSGVKVTNAADDDEDSESNEDEDDMGKFEAQNERKKMSAVNFKSTSAIEQNKGRSVLDDEVVLRATQKNKSDGDEDDEQQQKSDSEEQNEKRGRNNRGRKRGVSTSKDKDENAPPNKTTFTKRMRGKRN